MIIQLTEGPVITKIYHFRRVLVILDLEVTASGDKVTKKIGEPEPLSEDDLSSTAMKQAALKPNVSHETSCQPTTSKGHPNIVTLNQSLQDQLTHPISSLTPYQNKWIIKARVSNKSNIRPWNNSRGKGTFFSMDLVDESGEIRVTVFQDLVDKRVLVILDLEVTASGDKVTKKIGEPEPLSEDDLSSTAMKQAALKPNVSHETSCQPTTSKGHPNIVTLNQSLQDQLTHPISSLTPYQNKYIFSMDLVDESGEIRVTVFQDLVDKFYDYLEIDKVYYISKCKLKPANKQFTSLRNDYEMTLTNESIIQLCEDDVDSVPQTRYNFLTVDKIGQMEPASFVDVIGVCKAVSDLQTVQARSTGREVKKKELTLVDHTDNAISVTLWGQEAENFDGTSNPIIAIKGAKVGEFGGGKNLGTTMNGILKINPDIPEAHRLRGWYDNSGMHKEMKNLSARTGGNFDTPWMNFKEVREQNLGHSERGIISKYAL
ncbi:replication factor a 1 rfa1 [Holotrichia oblita]|uniref:Replication factor a 1 rfa1 n=1 Tax=Holotrichia oblita TaxID=644536 RepID=A0ACB9TXT7_HOLOL|nr:replication factor a 1 rfa1 [Holotrichia oblita]